MSLVTNEFAVWFSIGLASVCFGIGYAAGALSQAYIEHKHDRRRAQMARSYVA